MKKYTLKFTQADNGKLDLESKNDGFTSIELLGLIELRRDAVMKEMCEDVKVDVIKRELVKD